MGKRRRRGRRKRNLEQLALRARGVVIGVVKDIFKSEQSPMIRFDDCVQEGMIAAQETLSLPWKGRTFPVMGQVARTARTRIFRYIEKELRGYRYRAAARAHQRTGRRKARPDLEQVDAGSDRPEPRRPPMTDREFRRMEAQHTAWLAERRNLWRDISGLPALLEVKVPALPEHRLATFPSWVYGQRLYVEEQGVVNGMRYSLTKPKPATPEGLHASKVVRAELAGLVRLPGESAAEFERRGWRREMHEWFIFTYALRLERAASVHCGECPSRIPHPVFRNINGFDKVKEATGPLAADRPLRQLTAGALHAGGLFFKWPPAGFSPSPSLVPTWPAGHAVPADEALYLRVDPGRLVNWWSPDDRALFYDFARQVSSSPQVEELQIVARA